MTSTYTHMPLGREYLRAALYECDGKLTNYQLFPIQPFRAPMVELRKILQEHLQRVVNEFGIDRLDEAENSFTVGINQALVKLEQEGKIIFNHNHPTVSEATSVGGKVIAPSAMDTTDDGYIVFTYGSLPPTAGTSCH